MMISINKHVVWLNEVAKVIWGEQENRGDEKISDEMNKARRRATSDLIDHLSLN